MSLHVAVEILYNSGLDVEVTRYSAILNTLDRSADLAEDSHFVPREEKFCTLQLGHFQIQISYKGPVNEIEVWSGM